jgi:hypothetical protein
MGEVIPYARITQIKDFMRDISSEEIGVKELEERFGSSKIQNILPTLQLLNLCVYDRKNMMLKLTDIGKRFRSLLIINDEKRAAELIKPSIEKSEALSFVKMLLERKGYLSILEIGRELAFKFNKKWGNVLTYKAYGAACASILGFVGYGTYSKGILRKSEVKIADVKLTPPYAGFKKIFEIVKVVSMYGEMDLSTLSEKLMTKEGRLCMEVNNCIELGFLEKPISGRVAIRELGKELINPLNRNRVSEIFRNSLLYSNFRGIISRLSNTTFNAKELGEILRHQLGAKWLEEKTIETFGKKFLNWLNFAKLLEKTNEGKYKLSDEIIKDIFTKKVEKSPEVVLSVTDYYKLGKAMGTILFSNDFEKVKQAVTFLLEICKQDRNLSSILEIIEEHYKLFLDLKDSRIFGADVKLIEKLLGLEETGKV